MAADVPRVAMSSLHLVSLMTSAARTMLKGALKRRAYFPKNTKEYKERTSNSAMLLLNNSCT
jgi:hypothetical protein